MPVIKVSPKLYRIIILEAGKRGCTIGQAADALFLPKVDNAPLDGIEINEEVGQDEKIKDIQGHGGDLSGVARRPSPDLSEL